MYSLIYISESQKMDEAGALPPPDGSGDTRTDEATKTDEAIAMAMSATLNGDINIDIDEDLFGGEDLDQVEEDLETLELDDWRKSDRLRRIDNFQYIGGWQMALKIIRLQIKKLHTSGSAFEILIRVLWDIPSEYWRVHVAEWLVLLTSDHSVAVSKPAGGEILPKPKWRFIA